MKLLKKDIPLAICFVVGISMLATYYMPHRISGQYQETLNKWENIVAAFAFVLGLMSLFVFHWNKIKKGADGWGYSIFVYIGFLTMVIPSLISNGRQMNGQMLTPLGWSFRYIYSALSSTMFSVLAFYIVSTVYRSFRIKSGQTFVLFLAAFILIIGKVPLGQMVWDGIMGGTSVGASQVGEWIMSVPAVAARRGIMRGIALGAIATSLKIMLGIERQYMGKD
ncbi:MAG: hypothetical protein ABIG11_10175 [bacterium]